MELQINGAKIEFNNTDWKVVECEEKARKAFNDSLVSLRGLDGSKAIKKGCQLIIRYFDRAFGAGSAKAILGNETDLTKCMAAMTEAVTQVAKVQNELVDAMEGLSENVSAAKQAAHDGTYRAN